MATNLKLFLKENKREKETTTFPATKSLCDEDGNPLLWEIRAISTKESEDIRESCTTEIPVKGKPGMYRQKIDTSKYIAGIMCASVVTPDLYNKDLQDSYGVMTPEELIKAMIDNPGEYNDFANFIQNYSGFETMQDKVDEAKN